MMSFNAEQILSPKNMKNSISFGIPKESTNQNEYFVANTLQVPNFENMMMNKQPERPQSTPMQQQLHMFNYSNEKKSIDTTNNFTSF